MDKKTVDEVELRLDAEADVENALNRPKKNQNRTAAEATKDFLPDFYSPFAMELLSSGDVIVTNQGQYQLMR